MPRLHISRSYDSGTNRTTISGMVYDPDGAVLYKTSGERFEITRLSATSFTVRTDVSNDDFFVGFEYETSYKFTTQTLKQPTERGGRSSSNFTKQLIRNGAIDYSDTGHFTVEVTPLYRDTYKYIFNPTTLGADSVIGSLVLIVVRSDSPSKGDTRIDTLSSQHRRYQ